jgi:hypothetical protein
VIPESIRDLIATGPHVHLTTLNPDGSPQVSVVWIGIEVVCAHMGEPRAALSFLGRGTNAMGLHEYVVVYGSASVTEGDATDLLQRLAAIYLGPGVVFPPEPFRSRTGNITHNKPERFAGVGPWSPGQR